MLFILLLVLLAGAGAIFFVVRNSTGTSLVNINTRLGRYGMGGSSQVIAPGSQTAAGQVQSQSTVTRSMEAVVKRGGFAQPLANRLDRADLKMTPVEYFSIWILVFVMGMLVGLVTFGTLGLMAGGLLAIAAPWFYLSRRIKTRKKKFTGQLADMAQMMGNSMRAGFSIIQSMELVGSESAPPAADEFTRVVTEVKLGLPLDAALDHLLIRQPSEDLELLVVAINVQRQIGGNLSEILMVISQTIRERVRFERDLSALTAQARYSSYIITALPLAVAFVINLMDHPYESYLYTTLVGHFMIGAALLLLAMGFFFLNRIANIEV